MPAGSSWSTPTWNRTFDPGLAPGITWDLDAAVEWAFEEITPRLKGNPLEGDQGKLTIRCKVLPENNQPTVRRRRVQRIPIRYGATR